MMFELDETALEDIFSTRNAKFGGWAAALDELSYEIDPDGSFQIPRGPRPRPVHPDMVVNEGSLSRTLLTGVPNGGAVPRGTRGWQAEADPLSAANAIVQTLARINKYGEPAQHLRDDLLRTGHFLIEDLAHVTPQLAQRNPRAMLALQASSLARAAVSGAISSITPRRVATRASHPSRRIPPGALPLDDFDMANAALDLLMATDSEGKDVGYFSPRDSDDAHNFAALLVEVASARPVFGGNAPAGSPQEAIACKAFDTLVFIAAHDKPHADVFRTELFGILGNQIIDPARDVSKMRAATSALALAGIATAAEAHEINHSLIEYLTSGRDDETAIAVRTTKALLTQMRGPAAETMRSEFKMKVEQMEASDRQSIDSPEEHRFLQAWSSIPADVSPVSVSGPCAPPPGESRGHIFLFAICVDGLQPIDKLYVGVPTVVEAQFESPVAENELSLDISAAGSTKMVARKVDPVGRIFRTDPFVPGGSR